jgi:hypothetical protein
MSLHPQSSQDASNELHPAVYKAAAVLLIWFVAAAWLLFGGAGYIHLVLAVISVLVGGTMALLAVLLRAGARARKAEAGAAVSRQSEAAAGAEADAAVSNRSEAGGDAGDAAAVSHQSEAAGQAEPLGSWLHGEFSTWTDQRKGSSAAIEILLPVAAVAIGITVLGIVFDVVHASVM